MADEKDAKAAALKIAIEQIEKQRVGKLFVRPGGLSHTARPKQEKALFRRRLKQSWIHESFLPLKYDLSILILKKSSISEHCRTNPQEWNRSSTQ